MTANGQNRDILQRESSERGPYFSGGLIARNTIYNLIGQILPMLVALATIPIIIRGLGVDRYGILTLAWMVIGYFSLFDMGLGRATTKFVAEYLAVRNKIDDVGIHRKYEVSKMSLLVSLS